MTADATTTLEAHRRLLVGAAYRILGSHADAEDVVQEAWIRWSAVDPETVDDARAYLLTITSRLALNRLRQLRARRESYVGPWLPGRSTGRRPRSGSSFVAPAPTSRRRGATSRDCSPCCPPTSRS